MSSLTGQAAYAPVAIFDFDGTLANSMLEVIAAYNRVAPWLAIPPLEAEHIPALRELGPREAMREAGMPLWKLPFLMTAMRLSLRSRMHLIQPFAGIPEAVRALRQRGVRCLILTSNSRPNVQAFLARHALSFDLLSCGASMLGKGAQLRKVARRAALDPKRTFYVGDEVRDVVAAREAGIHSVAVSWGYGAESALAAERPSALVNRPEELVDLLCRPAGHERASG